MESPIKKLNFDAADKENQPLDEAAIANQGDDVVEPEVKEVTKPIESKEVKKDQTQTVVVSAKRPEQDEPILKENPQRFVLFPIKYHEVRDLTRRTRKVVFATSLLYTILTPPI